MVDRGSIADSMVDRGSIAGTMMDGSSISNMSNTVTKTGIA